MTEHELRTALKQAAAECQLSELRRRQIITQMKGEEPVKKKVTFSVVLAMALVLLTLSVAAALVHSTIANTLYGSAENAPKELTERIQTPDLSVNSTLGILTLDEWLYDGHSLHTSFTVANPTTETLLYTLDGIYLNDAHVSYNRIKTEGAGDSGFLLGGTLNGQSLPTSVSLYNQGDALYQFNADGRYAGMTSIPEGPATLRIKVAVWRPINTPELLDYDQYEGLNTADTKDHLVADHTGYTQLHLFRPEEYNLYYNAAQSGAEIYEDAYKVLGWAELADFVELEIPLDLNKEEAVCAVPVATEYDLGSCTLVLEQFELSHAGGRLDGYFSGDYRKMKELMVEYGLCLVDRENNRVLNNGCIWDYQPEEADTFHFTMYLNPLIGELPKQLWLAPAIAFNNTWEESDPHYDPNAAKPENVVECWQLDYGNAAVIDLNTTP